MYLGARTDQLEQLATRMRTESGRGTALLTALGTTVRSVRWTGEDADGLRSRWTEVEDRARDVLETLVQCGVELREHAREQDLASAAETTGVAGGGVAEEGVVEDGAAEYDDDGWEFIGWNYLFGIGWDGGWNPFTFRRNLRDDIPIDDPDEYGIASMNQMGAPNCITIAMLGGLSEQDPQYFMDRIEQVGREEYQVTLYENGEPVTVTVAGEILSDGARGSDGLQNWMTLYEAALIEQGVLEEDGSYAGAAGDVVEAVTGVPMPTDLQLLEDPEAGIGLGWRLDGFGVGQQVDPAAIEALMAQGYTVVLGTDDTNADQQGVELVEHHAYLVVGTDGTTFRLENPWGAGDTYGDGDGDRAPYLTEGQILANTDSTYVAPPREEWVEER